MVTGNTGIRADVWQLVTFKDNDALPQLKLGLST